MSDSPIRRLSTASSTSNLKREENLINAYEAEEERIINVLSRKLEQLREEKIQLENALEAESESHVNRLSRELSALRMAQQQQQMSSLNGSSAASPDTRIGVPTFLNGHDPTAPSPEVMLEAMRRENEQLRNRLVDTERDYVRISRLNEIYREELLDHRRRLGLSVDNLIGLSSSDPYSQPTHRRSASNLSSPSTSVIYSSGPRPTHSVPIPSHGVPIPRPSSSIYRPLNNTSETNTPLSHSPSSTESPFPFSPIMSTNPASFVSNGTHLTTPPSSASLQSNPPAPYPVSNAHTLTYPSVPPPSLSSSYGSPVISYLPHRDSSASPAEPLSRRGSNARGGFDRRIVEPGTFRNSRSHSRRESIERGARIAETGTLIPRSRAGSQSLAATTEASDSAELGDIPLTPFFSMSYQYPYVQGYSSMPTTPQTPYHWDGGDPQQQQHVEQQVLQHPLQQQQHQGQELYATSSTIQLQEQIPVVPSQNPRPGHHAEGDGELRLQHMSVPGSMRPEEMRPSIHVDTTRHIHVGTSASPPSGPPSVGGSSYHGPTGPMRTRVSPSHTDPRTVAHPYRRPQSAAGTGAIRPRREHEETQSVRYPRNPSGSYMPAPTTTPARLPANHSGTVSATSSLVSPAHPASRLPDGPKFMIRTDIHYNTDTNVLTAVLELPGLKKSDLSIVLSTSTYNRVKQVVVTGKNRSVFTDTGYAVRERKFGEFSRTLVVSNDTKPEDVTADMQDGLLTIKIRLPPPPEEEEGSQEIIIN
ncbi:hypothetical protein HYDPIDRAFT_176125 [Hydnomerulius pinastri MD-312]|uniref:Unplaced genomic scaffold scaffold_18, whole genome shotgun sequence n=1 Tax=Hydnomerulius pinastri MD-312 TaxID=994086 RepID=A0A0C9W789_9AGAM|nr:hypothetical protein HYDPIDRAFT_176125 [Hydnomerulius pinastri MD-312]